MNERETGHTNATDIIRELQAVCPDTHTDSNFPKFGRVRGQVRSFHGLSGLWYLFLLKLLKTAIVYLLCVCTRVTE